MSRFYPFLWEGLHISVRPPGQRRLPLVRRLPYLTGDPIEFCLSVQGHHNAVTHIASELEHPDGSIKRLQPQLLNDDSDLVFQQYGVSGQYQLFLSFESVPIGRGFVSHHRQLAATLQVIEDYKPMLVALNLIVGAVIGITVGVLVTSL